MTDRQRLNHNEDADSEFEHQARLVSGVQEIIIRIEPHVGGIHTAEVLDVGLSQTSLPNELEYLPHTSSSNVASKTVFGLTLDKAEILAPKIGRSQPDRRARDVALLPARVFSIDRDHAIFFDPTIIMEGMFKKVMSAIQSAFETRCMVHMYLESNIENLCAYHITFRWLRMLSQAVQIEAWLLKLMGYRRLSVEEIEAVWACRNTTSWERTDGIRIIPRYHGYRRAFTDPSVITTLGSNVLRVIIRWPGWISTTNELDYRYLLDLEIFLTNTRHKEDLLGLFPNPFNPGPAYPWFKAVQRPAPTILPLGNPRIKAEVDQRHDSLRDLAAGSTNEPAQTRGLPSINEKRKRDTPDSSDGDDGENGRPRHSVKITRH